eukprot:gene14770-biopygen1520
MGNCGTCHATSARRKSSQVPFAGLATPFFGARTCRILNPALQGNKQQGVQTIPRQGLMFMDAVHEHVQMYVCQKYYLYMRRQYPDLSKDLTKAFLDDEAKNDLRPP